MKLDLHEALRLHGLSAATDARTPMDGRKTIFNSDWEAIGRFTAEEGWAMLEKDYGLERTGGKDA